MPWDEGSGGRWHKVQIQVQSLGDLNRVIESLGNHAVEYLPNEDGVIPMQRILDDTDVFIELDTYWAYHAEVDPVAEMERLGKRLALIHIKDGDPSLASECGKPLGLGTAPVSAVYQKAIELGLPMVVESETLTPSGLDEIDVCINHLKSLE